MSARRWLGTGAAVGLLLLLSLLPALPALAQSAQTSMHALRALLESRVYGVATPESRGAKGDGIVDDTTKLQSWVDYCLDNDLNCRAMGTYRTTATITFAGGATARAKFDMRGSTIKPDAAVLTAVQIGTTAELLSNVTISGLLVDRTAYSGATENIGILYKHMDGVRLEDVESRYSKYNHVLRPDTGDSIGYNTFQNLIGTHGYYNLWIDPQGTGWANENVWLGGRLFPSTDTVWNLYAPTAGSNNNNRFFGLTAEGSGTGAIYCNGSDYLFDMPRVEGTWTDAAIRLGSGSLRNTVRVGRQDQDVANEGSGNTIEMVNFRVAQTHTAARLAQKIQRTNTTAVTALGAVTADTTAGSASITNVSSVAGIALGEFLAVAGGLQMGRVESISGTTIVVDTVAHSTVAGAALSRVAPPAFDVSDDFRNSGDSYAARLYVGRTGATSYLLKAYARDTLAASIDGNGLGYFAGGAQLAGAVLKAYTGTAAPSLATIAAGTVATFNVTVTGAVTATDLCEAGPLAGSPGAGLVWSARVSAADTCEVRVANPTLAPVVTTDRTWRAVATRAS